MKRPASIAYWLIFTCFYLPVLYVFYQIFGMKDLIFKITSFLCSNMFIKTLTFSFTEALLSALISIVLAFPAAYFFGRFNFHGKRWWRSLLVLPFMMPGIVIVLGMVVFYGQNGLFNHLLTAIANDQIKFTGLYGFWGIVLAHVVYDLPLGIRMLSESWERIDPNLREASANLGARPFFTLRNLSLPLLFSTIGYLFLIVFSYSFLSFTVVLVFGGFIYKTFEVLIYIEYNSRLQFERAAMIAGVQSLILLLVFFFQVLTHQKLRHPSKNMISLPNLCFSEYPWRKAGFVLYNVLLIFFLAGPFSTVIWRSFTAGGTLGGRLSFENYRLLFTEAFRFAVGNSLGIVLLNSLLIAVAVAVVTVGFAYFFARERRRRSWGIIDLGLQLPLGISFMSFGFGLGTLFGEVLPVWVLIIWAQVYLAFPLVYSVLRTAWRDVDETFLESSFLLGATSGYRLFTLEVPLLRRAIQTGIAYAMAISLSDLAAVMLLGKGEVITLSMAIYRLIGHYRFAQATSLGSIFIGISFAIFVIIEFNIDIKREKTHFER